MSWTRVRIGDLVQPVSKWNPKKSPTSPPFTYIDLSSVDKERKLVDNVSIVNPKEAPSRARQLVQENDVLVATVRPNLNGVAMVSSEHDGATASTGYCVLRPNPKKLHPSFLFHWVKTQHFINEMTRKSTGANYPAVSDKIVKEHLIPLPPINEQKRIAAILDKANSLCNLIERLKSEKDVFILSLFTSMFGDVVNNSFNFPTQKLGEIVSINLGQSPSGESYNEDGTGVPFLQGNAEFTSLHPVHKKSTTEPNKMSKVGDVLLSVRAPVGAINIADREYCIGRGLAAIEPNEKLNQAYLQYCFVVMEKILQSKATGSTFKAVTGRVLRSFEIPIPPIALQQRFAFLLSRTRDIDFQEGSIQFTELKKSVIQEVFS